MKHRMKWKTRRLKEINYYLLDWLVSNTNLVYKIYFYINLNIAQKENHDPVEYHIKYYSIMTKTILVSDLCVRLVLNTF